MLIGLLLGIVIGLVLSPLLRSWLTWRQYVAASREARLTEDVMRRMSETVAPAEQDLSHTGGPGSAH
jgi:hypothetical protein